MTCLACYSEEDEELMVGCSSCKGKYHYTCVGISAEHYEKIFRNVQVSTWRCPSCSNITRRQKGEETPVRKQYGQSPPGCSNTDMSICDDSPKNDFSRIEDLVLRAHTECKNTMDASMRHVTDSFSSMLDTKLGTVQRDIAGIDAKINTTKQEIFMEISKEVGQAIDKIKQEFSDTTDFLSEQIASCKSDISSLNLKVKELALENSRLGAELLTIKNKQKHHSDTSELHEIVDQMKMEINERDQALLLNDVEISGVPEYKTESTIHIAQAISMKLGMQVEERDIVSANRVGPIRVLGPREAAEVRITGDINHVCTDAATNTTIQSGPRPRPLVVRLTRRALRDELLRNARTRRGLNTSDLGLPEHRPVKIYVNERLTKFNRIMFWKGRQAAKAANWKYVWTREGRIYAKRSDDRDSRTVLIKSEKDIGCVFGVVPSLPESK